MTGMLSLAGVSKQYRAQNHNMTRAMDDINLEVEDNEFFTFVGPSGCGKTTSLRCIAGLETPDTGRIEIGGEAVYDSQTRRLTPPSKRRLGMVFQGYAVWPHMTVFENVAFPLRAIPRRKRPSRESVRRQVSDILEVMGMGGMGDRNATELSGGQQQRIALARALIGQPRLLLLDEPFSSLDAKVRDHMKTELKRVQREVAITTIFVTHDQSEALTMSDRLAVMQHGQIVQVGTPRQIYEAPKNLFVATFLGSTNVFPGEVTQSDASTHVQVAHQGALLLARALVSDLGQGDAVCICVRAESLRVRPASDRTASGPALTADRRFNTWRGTVESVAFSGSVLTTSVEVASYGGSHSVTVTSRSTDDFVPGVGQVVVLEAPVSECLAVHDDAHASTLTQSASKMASAASGV